MLAIVAKSPLFFGVDKEDIASLLDYLEAKKKSYKKDTVLFAAGSKLDSVGIVIKGAVQIVRDDVYGNRTITANLTTSDIFGEVFACLKTKEIPISVVSATDCEILYVNFKKVLQATCKDKLSSILLENMLTILAQKNYLLTEKLEIVTAKNIRDRIWSYFLRQKIAMKSDTFTIPFNRQELADYLSVNRSALSRELSSMKDEGLIDFEKDRFTLISE